VTILLLSENFPPKTGGSSRWFWEIYRRLPQDQVLIAAGEDPRQESVELPDGLRVERLPLTLRQWGLASFEGLRGYRRSLGRLRPLLKSERITMVHSGRNLPEGLLALALKCRRGIPYACYVHGEEVNTASTSRELSWLTRRVLHGAAFLIANSRNTEQLLEVEWGLPAERIRVLHPGVDCQRFVPAPRDARIRTELGWHQRPVILTVGRLQKRKGHDQMILALGIIRKTIPDVLYAIIGDGEERPYLQELVTREGLGDHVQFRGEVDDEGLVRCYQQCDLFALPNRQVGKDIEGFGMVLLEAQACGKPVLAGASGGTAETMKIPETGHVVNCEGPRELAALVTELLTDRERLARMGAAARPWVLERFDWAALGRQAEQVFGLTPESRSS
jgi:phosphatidylinositol alpha-1,6-mannosyltransferase